MFFLLKPWQSWQCVLFHLYECQETQIKNRFDPILSLSFNLEYLKVNTYYISHNFVKDYKKDSYDKKNLRKIII
jgi:hypothetical protein